MINIVYIDDEMFSTQGSLYEDISDVWKYNLKDVNSEFNLFLFDDVEKCINKLKLLGNNTVLILDIRMELINTDGATVLKEIRKSQITFPVIGYSANKNNDKNDIYLIPLLENDLFDYVLKNPSDFSELVNSINKAIDKFKDNIPLELTEALNEYIERHPELKDSKIFVKKYSENKEIPFSEIVEQIFKGTKFGKNYQKAMYKLAIEDLLDKKKVIHE